MQADELTDEDLQAAANEALDRPDNFGRHIDLGQYETHGRTFTHVYSADDIVAESNFYTVIEILNAAECQDDFYVTGERDWAFGNMETIYVRVRDDKGEFTKAWREVTACAFSLRDYPVLNDSDYSTREWAAFEAALESEWTDVARKFEEYDDDDVQAALKPGVMEAYKESCSEWGPDSVDTDLLIEMYKHARDDHYTTLAEAHLDAAQRELHDTHTGQLPPLAE